MRNTQSWNTVASWYDSIVGEKGQYFHTHVIFPRLLPLLDLKPGMRVLDLACGQGAFCREVVKKHVDVTGIDVSARLIESALKYVDNTQRKNLHYFVDDARDLRKLSGESFDRVTCILALQNMDPIDEVFSKVRTLLNPSGTFTIVMLHPAFRSPRITGWGEDPARKLQFRRIDRYMSPMQIPIDMHPGGGQRQLTWTYHRPLQEYVDMGVKNGFSVTALEEWVSDKVSEGRNAKSENLARAEIPLFMAIRYLKN